MFLNFWFRIRLRIFVFTHITFPFLSRKKLKTMSNQLAARIRELTHAKIDFVDDEAEGKIMAIVDGTLSLDDAADKVTALIGEDADLNEVADGLVDLADIFDDAEMDADKRDKLDGVVNKLVKSGTDEQKDALKDLFTKVLGYGLTAKDTNDYFDTLLAVDPDGDGEE